MKLTELESKIMTIIWQCDGKSSVNTILQNWKESKVPKYTTVLKILQILEKKDIVGHKRNGRSYVYFSKLNKEESLKFNLKKIVSDFFGGNKLLFANNFLNETDFTPEELHSLKTLLKEKEKGQKSG